MNRSWWGSVAPTSWTPVIVGGLAAMVVAFVLICVVAEFPIPPVVILGVLAVVLAVGIKRAGPKRWLLVLAGLFATLAMLGNAPVIVEDLSHLDTFWTFFPTLLAVVAAVLVVASVIAALAGVGAGARMPVWAGAASAAAVLTFLSAAATLGVESDQMVEGDVVVVAKDVEFSTPIEATAGEVAIFVENQDRFRHTFVIQDRDVKTELPGSTNRRITVNLEAGTYRFFCDVPGHEDMEGVLEVS